MAHFSHTIPVLAHNLALCGAQSVVRQKCATSRTLLHTVFKFLWRALNSVLQICGKFAASLPQTFHFGKGYQYLKSFDNYCHIFRVGMQWVSWLKVWIPLKYDVHHIYYVTVAQTIVFHSRNSWNPGNQRLCAKEELASPAINTSDTEECWWTRDQVNSGPGQLVNSGPSEFGTTWFRDQRLVNSGPNFGEFGTKFFKYFLY